MHLSGGRIHGALLFTCFLFLFLPCHRFDRTDLHDPDNRPGDCLLTAVLYGFVGSPHPVPSHSTSFAFDPALVSRLVIIWYVRV